MTAVVQTDRLTKRYGGARGIEDLSMTVRPGEIFGFLGPNGAGKTTTIRTLLDLLHPTSGSARLFGLDSHRDSRAIRARLGNLPGDFSYEPRVTGRAALEHVAALRGVRDLRRADALAERFRADLSRRIGDLSRGNRQKVGLIQALFHEPELLILDEPTGGLDPLMQEEFLAVIGEERDRGATVLLSSHDLDEVQRACDRVAMVRDGRLIAVEDVAAMRARAHREVSVRFAGPVAAAELAALPGVTDLRTTADTVHFHVSGPIDPVIKAIARHEVGDLEVTRPTLEELFLSYYRAGTA
ncbi:ABC transporter ATP-binding protein [Baekduia soli]|uniref:ABC transporter ATP-binding protein n=1 Tax=Baekduia soli TaxID=496014 RepID=A0A5B8U1Q4_9ACTN|nr:ABC transporter ATP-binding protein [Baekduia soli]QEC46926.1 ABC transporter ATP-binding protein [Baekduia soli]